jgi:hypothetical protein
VDAVINGWIRSANGRYATHLATERRAREADAALERDPNERIREAAEKFKHLAEASHAPGLIYASPEVYHVSVR